jgi:hypothetical protein
MNTDFDLSDSVRRARMGMVEVGEAVVTASPPHSISFSYSRPACARCGRPYHRVDLRERLQDIHWNIDGTEIVGFFSYEPACKCIQASGFPVGRPVVKSERRGEQGRIRCALCSEDYSEIGSGYAPGCNCLE